MPHVIPRSTGPQRKIVILGAGPGGLEAARVSAERGHKVVLFEAEGQTGGQVNIAAKATWREALSGITRWLDGQVRKHGVDLRLGKEAGKAEVLAEAPDVVVIATGGTPNKGPFKGADLAVSGWDILSGRVAPGENVLIFDDHGGHQGPSVAEFVVKRGALVELATPERLSGIEIGGTSYPIHQRELYKAGVIFTPDMRLIEVGREGNKLIAVLRNEYSDQEEERVVDQVVAEHGTLPRDQVYFDLKDSSTNRGEIDYHAFAHNRLEPVLSNPAGKFLLFRVGDALASRNIHAAIYDSLRICKDL
jgi:NADPH-dependent 2,4-dienoyl-CoA reductase/sulfur reductase-like enzyme